MENPGTTIERKRKPTIRQRKAAQLIVDTARGKTGLLTDAEIVRAAGYKQSIEDAPAKVLGNPGVLEALDDLGFNEDTAKKVIAKILNSNESKDENKIRAADLVFKVKGSYAADPNIKENNANPIIYAKIEQHIYNFESELKKALGYETIKSIEEETKRD